ncbi:hypothetical protein RB620_26355 [Paenibacillus sp. LHD-117]|uniref:hypothetical protein n=1 Tax=Paenibacillus sp. LHD-117 TaxID=3071412 RepID=UPI0027E14A84|nr:hypothetical protein [Paenibacillus sp. LHD-117]MDQ6422954.1 hypothetical protein [Paenibacillus sp. LHD-117]
MVMHWNKVLSLVIIVSVVMAITNIAPAVSAEAAAPEPVIIDVTDYGAIPNSMEDAASPVQQALAAAAKVEGPVVIHFPEGR